MPQRPQTEKKFETKTRRSVFLGYVFGEKTYKLYDPEENELITSRYVNFQESTFPFDNEIEIVMISRKHY